MRASAVLAAPPSHNPTCTHWSKVLEKLLSWRSTFSTSLRIAATKRDDMMVDMVTRESSRAACRTQETNTQYVGAITAHAGHTFCLCLHSVLAFAAGLLTALHRKQWSSERACSQHADAGELLCK